MSRAKHSLIPAWVLRALPYRDTSLLIEAMTRDHGRVGLVARGARSGRGAMREQLQCFRPVLMSWSESGDLGALTGVESGGPPITLRGEQVFSGWYLNELLLRLIHRHDPQPGVFDAYSSTLSRLPDHGEAELRYFETTLLAELGFGLDLSESIEPGGRYSMDSGEPIRQSLGDGRDACSGRTLIALRERTLGSEQELREARRLLRAHLAHHLGDKPLATAVALRQLRGTAMLPRRR